MKHVLVLVLSIGVSALIGGIVYSSIPQTAFVDNPRLFQGFEGRKELENRLEQEFKEQKAVMDTLSMQIKATESLAQTDEEARKRYYYLQQQYQQLSQAYQGGYQQKSQEYIAAIWKQISQYCIDYGKEKGYDYVFGIAGQGSLMYGKERSDITEEVLTYINSKYAGN